MTTRYTIAQLTAQSDATLPDNTAQDISPADVRTMFNNFLMSIRPTFATMRRDTALVLALTPTPQVFKPWSVAPYQDPPETTVNLANGTITRQVASLGNSSGTERITFYIGVAGTSGAELTFQLYDNGVPTDIIARVSTTGAANVITVVLSGLLNSATDSVFDVRVSSTNSSNYTFSNGTFRVEGVAVAA